MHNRHLAAFILILLVASTRVAVAQAAATSPQAQAMDRDNQVATSFSASCICDQGNGYINAYSYQIPFRPESYKVGTVITVSAGGCQYISACKVRALVGTIKMKIDSWNSNTGYVYKFAINGPIQ
jgi:hypothetical protein